MTLHVPLHPDRVVLARSRTAFALVTLVALLATDVTSLPAQAPGTAKGLAPPNNLWAAQTSAKELTIVWDAVPGATEYRLYSSMSAVASGIGNFAPVARAIQSRGSAIMRMVLDIFRTLPGGESLYIQAVDAAGRLSPMTPFNPVIPVAKSAVPVKVLPPTNVLATETAPGVITLSSTPREQPPLSHSIPLLCRHQARHFRHAVRLTPEPCSCLPAMWSSPGHMIQARLVRDRR